MATSDKYDRQLRLWGASGQRALGETTIVLVNATSSGTETLKNLGELGLFVVGMFMSLSLDGCRPGCRWSIQA